MDYTNKLKEILSKMPDIVSTNITEDTEFRIDLGMDSVDLAELMFELEQTFNIQIQEEEFESLNTIGELMEFVSKKQSLQTA